LLTTTHTRARTMLGCLLAFSAAVVAAACAPSMEFSCHDDAQCTREDAQGLCEPAGFCSFPDPACTSGRRYAELAADALAQQCVAPDSAWSASDEDTDTSAATSTESGSGEIAEESTTPDPGAVSDAPESESSGGDGSSGDDGTTRDAWSSDDGAPGESSTGDESGGSSGTAAECGTSVLDDFEDGVVDAAWTLNVAPGSTIAEDDGELRIAIAAGVAANSIVSGPVDASLLGGWALVRLENIASSGSSASSGLVVGVGGCDLQIYVHQGVVRALRYSAAAGPLQLGWVALPGSLPLWLRIRLDEAATAHFELSTDATAWTNVASDDLPECGDLGEPPIIGMFAGGGPASAVTRTFDEIAVCVP
jgi:hypothetical protein